MKCAVHISSVHSAEDPRIRKKQIGALSSSGWVVHFVTGDMQAPESTGENIFIHRIWPGNHRRVFRFMITTPLAILRALFISADVYHVHDPELLPWAWLLLVRRKPVIYDVHEDYVTSIQQKEWIPVILRNMMAHVIGYLEHVLAWPFRHVIAERYYIERFPKGVQILNYPLPELLQEKVAYDENSRNLLYTGSISVDRGALCVANVIAHMPDWSATMVGKCPNRLADEISAMTGGNRVEVIGVGRFVPPEEIREQYGRKAWFAGIALFPESHHYMKKELTKLYEYMAVGLPIIASGFPVWKRLIEGNGIGVCVDAEDPDSIKTALESLVRHPEKGRRMSARGRELAMDVYNWEREGRRFVEFYSSLLGDCV